jgi:hypothetical protein
MKDRNDHMYDSATLFYYMIMNTQPPDNPLLLPSPPGVGVAPGHDLVVGNTAV